MDIELWDYGLNVGEDVEKLEPLYIASENVK